jgi:hypothetical protein
MGLHAALQKLISRSYAQSGTKERKLPTQAPSMTATYFIPYLKSKYVTSIIIIFTRTPHSTNYHLLRSRRSPWSHLSSPPGSLSGVRIGANESTEEPVHNNEIVAIVVFVGGVVDCVPRRAHDGQ